jgi:hypothetical protein
LNWSAHAAAGASGAAPPEGAAGGPAGVQLGEVGRTALAAAAEVASTVAVTLRVTASNVGSRTWPPRAWMPKLSDVMLKATCELATGTPGRARRRRGGRGVGGERIGHMYSGFSSGRPLAVRPNACLRCSLPHPLTNPTGKPHARQGDKP